MFARTLVRGVRKFVGSVLHQPLLLIAAGAERLQQRVELLGQPTDLVATG